MAIRTSAGSGVVVSLIVFVLLTVLLLVGAILLWGNLEQARKDVADANDKLDEYATSRERADDWTTAMMDRSGRESLVGYLRQQQDALGTLALGGDFSPDANLADVRTTLGMQAADSLTGRIQSLTHGLAEATAARHAAEQTSAEASATVSDLTARLRATEAERDQLLASQSAALKPYTDAESRHQAAMQAAIAGFEQSQATQRERAQGEITDLQDESDRLRQDNTRLKSRLTDLEDRLNHDRLKSSDPAALVDGRVIDVVGGGDHVYINLGRNDQVVLGMTFEVYDDAAQVPSADDAETTRGKASVQVVKVGESSSTAKVTRRMPGRPILRDNVITNAVYDPNYRFKFLVHGKFDVNSDGKATSEEAQYVRDRITRWGGEVVDGDRVPGDLDFLVLGQEPTIPVPPAVNASTIQYQDYQRMREIADTYRRLLESARQSEIPVLNENRLHILTGRTDL